MTIATSGPYRALHTTNFIGGYDLFPKIEFNPLFKMDNTILAKIPVNKDEQ